MAASVLLTVNSGSSLPACAKLFMLRLGGTVWEQIRAYDKNQCPVSCPNVTQAWRRDNLSFSGADGVKNGLNDSNGQQ